MKFSTNKENNKQISLNYHYHSHYRRDSEEIDINCDLKLDLFEGKLKKNNWEYFEKLHNSNMENCLSKINTIRIGGEWISLLKNQESKKELIYTPTEKSKKEHDTRWFLWEFYGIWLDITKYACVHHIYQRI